MQKLKFITLACVLAIIPGCATYVDIISRTDVNYQVWPTKKVAVFYDEEATIEERNFWYAIVDEMKKAGFNFVEPGNYDYILTYSISDFSYDYQTYMTLPDFQTSYIYDTYGQQQRITTYGSQYVPYTETENIRGILMFLIPKSEAQAGPPLKIVWSGGAWVDYDTFQAYPREVVATLLQFYGGQHEGKTKLIKRE
jgi:hypothetical protein